MKRKLIFFSTLLIAMFAVSLVSAVANTGELTLDDAYCNHDGADAGDSGDCTSDVDTDDSDFYNLDHLEVVEVTWEDSTVGIASGAVVTDVTVWVNARQVDPNLAFVAIEEPDGTELVAEKEWTTGDWELKSFSSAALTQYVEDNAGSDIELDIAVYDSAPDLENLDIDYITIEIEYDDAAPIIGPTDVEPEYPMCSDDVTVCADITDDSDITTVKVTCEVDGSSVTKTITTPNGDEYCADFSASTMEPEDADDLVCYFYAEDEHEYEVTTSPSVEATYDCAAPTVDFSCTPLSGDEDHEISCDATASDTVDSDLDYDWSFVGGAPNSISEDDVSDSNPASIWYYEDGFYDIVLTVTDNAGNTATETKNDYIEVFDVGPSASFTVSPGTTVDEGVELSFTDTSTSHDPFLSWYWTFGDGDDSSDQHPMHTYGDDGLYTVELTVCDEDNDCDSTTTDITVENAVPDVNAGEYICDEGDTIPLTATATDVAADLPLIFEWDFNNDDVYDDASGANVDYDCQDGDDYVDGPVTVRVTDQDGGEGFDDAQITVNNVAPVADADGPYHTAVDELVCLDGSATDVFDTSFTYEWDFDYDGSFDVDSSTEDPCTSYSSDGVYTVAVRAHDGDDWSEVDTSTVTVHDYQIDFEEGANCFSIPLVPTDDDVSINNVLGEDVSSVAEIVWAYQYDEDTGKNVWNYNEPLLDGTAWTAYSYRLQEIVPGYGYYLYTDDGVTSYQDGEKFYGVGGEGIPMPPQVALDTGWNLIGHYGMNDVDKSDEVQDLSGGLLTDLADLTLLTEEALPTDMLEPKECYWTFVTGEDDLLYAPSAEDYDEDLD